MCVCILPVAEWCAVSLGDLLHFVVVSQHKQRFLEPAHLLHFGHYVFIDSIHDLLQIQGEEKTQLRLVFYHTWAVIC